MIDIDALAAELADNGGFRRAVQELVSESLPEHSVTKTSLQELFTEEVFNIPTGTFVGDGAPVERDAVLLTTDAVAEHLTAQLRSIPTRYSDRCTFGQAFTDGVRLALVSILAGDDGDVGDGTGIDAQLAATLKRVVPGVITYDMREPEPAPEPVYEDGHEQGRADDDIVWAREIMVLTMSGQRDGHGAVSVWGDATDEWFEVRKVGRDRTFRFQSKYHAFDKAFSLASWDVRTESTF